ncbi:MAG: type II toxin-antitoxin system HicB family antitoxin, partial [Candidatus Vecturithrix sp.]|nr:type II toxin-antitoxin system HicB family antitoxin [Candidatus Vecturithrix sp.]
WGKIEGIRDLITFEATDVKGLEQAFQETIEHYLRTCQQHNRAPQKTFKGRFNVRIDPELHKQAVDAATRERVSLNEFVKMAIAHEVEQYERRG